MRIDLEDIEFRQTKKGTLRVSIFLYRYGTPKITYIQPRNTWTFVRSEPFFFPEIRKFLTS